MGEADRSEARWKRREHSVTPNLYCEKPTWTQFSGEKQLNLYQGVFKTLILRSIRTQSTGVK